MRRWARSPKVKKTMRRNYGEYGREREEGEGKSEPLIKTRVESMEGRIRRQVKVRSVRRAEDDER